MAATAKAGSIFVEIALDKDQFDKDMKQVGREVKAEQDRISLDMQRNKIKFAVEGVDQNWAEKLFGATTLGKIINARKETEQLNSQITMQQNKVDMARNAWANIFAVKGQGSTQAMAAEKAFLREQSSLTKLKEELIGTTSATSLMGGTMKTIAMDVAAAVGAMAVAFATAVEMAVKWGESVKSITLETGMSDEAAAKMLGTMHAVGLGADEAGGLLGKFAKNVSKAALEQDAAKMSGKESEDIFTKLGIAITDSEGGLLDYPVLLQNVRAGLLNLAPGVERTDAILKMFGKSGLQMNEWLSKSDEQIAALAARYEKLGLAIKDSDKFKEFSEEMNIAKDSLTSMALTITEASIPALIEMIKKVEAMAVWLRENKDAVEEFLQVLATTIGIVAKPFIIGIEMMISALKLFIEWRQKAINEAKGPIVDDSTAKALEKENKLLDDNAKRADAAARARAEMQKKNKEGEDDLRTSILTLNGQALAAQLTNIDKEEKAWAAKCGSQQSASEWAEAARAKAHEDAQNRIDASMKTYEASLKGVQSAEAGIGSSFQSAFGSAIKEVAANLKAGQSAGADDAIRKIKEEYDLMKRASREVASAAGYSQEDINKGMFDPISAQAQVSKAFEALAQAQAKADQDKIAYLKTIAQNTTPGSGGNAGTAINPRAEGTVGQFTPQSAETLASIIAQAKAGLSQTQTVNMPVTVNVNGMDAYSAAQLGQIAAQQLKPVIIDALGADKSKY